MICEERAVRVSTIETKSGDEDKKPLVPGTGSLFKAIERFAKATNMIGKGRMKKSRRLFHVNFL